ncbi:hypothetical protein [Halalkalicoccus jeotgali]|uniref:Uncharacterized protein n=1 Tax=Halalkalicoccus jeotgali (strain DSM 18796 / CECT 7217 / JCM 14584 / KCTC 4019 / B3) TaxID=795797 RepID=D8J5D4_HALJB|nr:hypothetical protein [Halalkalicoccus jeotgali]ADJ15630.1 hypothetical protein HacjB3_11235 [Halalkalicoccus jeotgali B3]ELY36598.1 hypothetical protein C497_11423 [Halalkalicoccus jeotgali B3]
MRYVCTECDWHVDSSESLTDDLGGLAVEHHVRFGHPVELATEGRPRDEQTADSSVGT